MNSATVIAVVVALLGVAMIAGVFFAFFSFIMKALERAPASEGMAMMQSINAVVLNPVFLSVFFGTALLSLLVAGLAINGWGLPWAPWSLAGATLYLAGTFPETAFGNVPLNNRLASLRAADGSSVTFWKHYLSRWALLNTVRTVAGAAAAISFAIGLIQYGG